MSAKNVIVAVKVRPLIKREKDAKLPNYWIVSNNSISHVDNTTEQPFIFDHIFDEDVTNHTIFETVAKPLVVEALKGINATIFAYGQTSSGKTYTMTGNELEPGVIGMAVQAIFSQIEASVDRQFLLRVAYIEIYNEKVYDLLSDKNDDLKIHENANNEVYVESKEFICKSEDQILKHFEDGSKSRKVAETNMNDRSSRSHTIFRITIESREVGHTETDSTVQISNLNLVDLAGSERANQTGTSGSRLKEGSHINRSLLSLSRVIQKLSEPETDTGKFINYRDSKLTRILQASLGGNAMTVMICTVTPAVSDETYFTLHFAMRAKTIKNKPKVNEVLSDKGMMKRLEREIERLREQLKEEKSKNSEIGVRKVLSQISEKEKQFIQPHSLMMKLEDKSRRRTWCPSSSSLPVIRECRSGGLNDDDSSDQYVGEMLPPGFLQPKSDFINMRGHEILPPATPIFSLDDSSEFKSSEEFIMLEQQSMSSPRSTPNMFLVHTPIALRRQSTEVETPHGETLKYKYKQIRADFKELEEFTQLENRANVEHIQNEDILREYTRARIITTELLENYKKLQDELMSKEINLDVAEARIVVLEEKLNVAEAKQVEATNNEALQKEIACLQKSLDDQVKLTQRNEIIKNSVEYEFDEFKKRLKNREVELTLSLDKEREVNGTFIEKMKTIETQAQEIEEARAKLQQLLKTQEIKNFEQASMSQRISSLETELKNGEHERTILSGTMKAIDDLLTNLNFTRKTKYREIKAAFAGIFKALHPSSDPSAISFNDSQTNMDVSFEHTTSATEILELTAKIADLERSVLELTAKNAQSEKELKVMRSKEQKLDELVGVQAEFEKLSVQMMEQIEENDRLQSIIDSIKKQFEGKLAEGDEGLAMKIGSYVEGLLTVSGATTSEMMIQLENLKDRQDTKGSELDQLKEQNAQLLLEKLASEEKITSLENSSTDVDKLEANIIDANTTIKRMEQEINALNDQISALQSPPVNEDRLSSLQAELAELQSVHLKNLTHQEGMKSTMSWLEQEKKQLEDQIEKYKQEAAEACDEIESLKMSLHELERSELGNESADGIVVALRAELEATKAKLSELAHEMQPKVQQQQLKTLEADLEKSVATLANCDNLQQLEQINLSNEQTIVELENKIKAIEDEFELKMQQVKTEKEDLEKVTQVEVDALIAKIDECNSQAEVLQQTKLAMENTIAGLEAKITALNTSESELQAMRSQNQDYSNLIGQLEVEKQILAEAMTKEVKQYDEQINSYSSEITSLKSQLASLLEENLRLVEQQNNSQVKTQKLQDQIAEQQNQISQLEHEIHQQISLNEKSSEHIEDEIKILKSENENLKIQSEALESRSADLEKSNAAIETELSQAMFELLELRSSNQKLSSNAAKIGDTINGYKDKVLVLETENIGLKSRVIISEDKVAQAQQDATDLTEKLQQKIAEYDELKQKLRRRSLEKETIVADLMASVQDLEQQKSVFESIQKKLEAELLYVSEQQLPQLRKQVATLTAVNTDLLAQQKLLEDECVKAKQSSMDLQEVRKLEAQIANLESRLEESARLKTEYERLMNDHANLEKALSASEQQLPQLREQVSTLTAANTELKAQHKLLEDECVKVKQSSMDLQEVRKLEAQIVNLESRLEESARLKTEYERLMNDHANVEIAFSASEQQLREQVSILTAAKSKLETQHKLLQDNFLNLKQTSVDSQVVRKLEAQIANLESRLEESTRLKIENAKLINDHTNLKNIQQKFEFEYKKKEQDYEQLCKEKADLKQMHAFNIDQLQKLEKELKAVQDKEREYKDQRKEIEALQVKNEHYMLQLDEMKRDLDIDELRSATKRQQKSRRQSSHDEKRRQSMWDHRDKGMQTDPTDVNCSCESMGQQIKELKKDLFLKNAQVATFKKMYAINPLQNDFDKLKKSLFLEEKEKNSLIMENHKLIERLQASAGDCKKHKTSSTTSSTQTEVAESVSTPSLLTMAAPESGLVLKMENQRLNDDLLRLQKRYEDMKRLCRIRKEEILNLKTSNNTTVEKENESTNSNGFDNKLTIVETDNLALKKQICEWEEKYAALKKLYYTKQSKFTTASQTNRKDQNLQTDTTMTDLEQMEKFSKELVIKYGYAKKICEYRKDEIVELEKRVAQ